MGQVEHQRSHKVRQRCAAQKHSNKQHFHQHNNNTNTQQQQQQVSRYECTSTSVCCITLSSSRRACHSWCHYTHRRWRHHSQHQAGNQAAQEGQEGSTRATKHGDRCAAGGDRGGGSPWVQAAGCSSSKWRQQGWWPEAVVAGAVSGCVLAQHQVGACGCVWVGGTTVWVCAWLLMGGVEWVCAVVHVVCRAILLTPKQTCDRTHGH